MQKHNRFRRPLHGFTLIELLVVVAIIALLVAILLPSLQEARRMAKVVVCATNLRSYAMGLVLYATMDPTNQFPVQDSYYGFGDMFKVWTDSSPVYQENFPDKQKSLVMFRDIILGGDFSILWCPLNEYFYNPYLHPEVAGDPDWPELWYDNRFGESYMGGYWRFANAANVYSWSHSGNNDTDGPPVELGAANDAIVADNVQSEFDFYFNYHTIENYAYGDDRLTVARNGDNNVGYADGHVETHSHDSAYIEASNFINWDGGHYVERWVGQRVAY